MTTSKTNPSSQRNEKFDPIWTQLDDLGGALANLQALLVNTYGDSLESFSLMNDDLRDAYLAHCADLAGAAKKRAFSICEEALVLARAESSTPNQAT